MHVLFVHKNFPAQFGHVARHLIRHDGCRCTFVSETPAGEVDGIAKIQYRVRGGATQRTHYCSRTFENATWHAAAVYEALKPHRQTLRPDLIVGHSGFGSTLFLPELFPDTPVLNYFEYYYRPHHSDMDFRPEWPVPEVNYLRSRARNAMILLDLEACRAGYTPTRFQHSLFPEAYRPKLQVVHDGIDTQLWHRRLALARALAGLELPAGARVVTYVSRGLESMRGFDIFMRAARRIYERCPNVVFLVIGSSRVCYGGDLNYIEHKSFLDHVLAQEAYDLSKFRFLGRLPPSRLADLLSVSDLHIYLTVPFVLSWSMLNAMACGCTVLGSRTPPVEEILLDRQNGLLVDFFDAEGIARVALEVLADPAAYRPLGERAAALIAEQYSLEAIMPRMRELYRSTCRGVAT